MKKVKVVTLGCSKNLVDSEFLIKQLQVNNFSVDFNPATGISDIVIINTCGFIGDAKQESIETILGFVEEKKKGNIQKIFVTGCLSQRYRNELRDEIPEVDGYFGVDQLAGILRSSGAKYKEEFAYSRTLTTPSHYAYLKISEGCNRSCAFCAIPQIRGKYKSKPVDGLINETALLIKSGVREIQIIAQDISSYGKDLIQKTSLPELVTELAMMGELEWIRLHYAYPEGFPADLIKVMNKFSNICKYLDIPVQHISDNVLQRMKRGHNKQDTIRLIRQLREEVPGIVLRTTLLVGFPGESVDDFKKLKDFVSEMKFDRLGVFAYSEEENTLAWKKYPDDVPSEIKAERVGEIMQIQQDISFELNMRKIGEIHKVIIDRRENDFYIGRTEFDSPDVDNEVLIKPDDQILTVGNFYQVRITGAEPFDLYGEIAGI